MRKVKSLHGLLEYDNWWMYRDEPRCNVRLTLFNVPVGSTMVLRTIDEMQVAPSWDWSYYRVSHRPIVRAFKMFPGQQCDHTLTVLLASQATLSLEVYNARKELAHHIAYRIDQQQKRPVRGKYLKMDMRLEEEMRPAAPHGSLLPALPVSFPEHSLFASVSNDLQRTVTVTS